MTVKLHKFGPAWGLADPSPFCLKLESFLRETAIAYTVVPFDLRRTFRRAPKGKLPFIEDTDGTVIGDSSLIIAHLSRKRGIDLDAALDPRQRAIAHACRRMLDEHTYWVGVYARWLDQPGWSVVREQLFSGVPALVRGLLAALPRRRIMRALRAQGIGRQRRDEIYALGIADVQVLSTLLATDTYFFAAARPTLLDLWTYAFVAEIIVPPIASPLKDATLAHGNLLRHCELMQQRLFPVDAASAGEGT